MLCLYIHINSIFADIGNEHLTTFLALHSGLPPYRICVTSSIYGYGYVPKTLL